MIAGPPIALHQVEMRCFAVLFLIFATLVIARGASSSASDESFSYGDNGECADVSQQPWSPPTQFEWTYTAHGRPSDLVNLYIHGSLDNIRTVFADSEWTEPAPLGTKNSLKYFAAAFLNIHRFHRIQHIVQSMPVTILTLCGAPETIAFEKDNHPLGGRDHFRIYDTNQKDTHGLQVWAVAATHDIKLGLDLRRPQTLFLTHDIDKNQDSERYVVMNSIKESGFPFVSQFIEPEPITTSPAVGGAYSEDGLIYDIVLGE
jgi:hypothetical protein